MKNQLFFVDSMFPQAVEDGFLLGESSHPISFPPTLLAAARRSRSRGHTAETIPGVIYGQYDHSTRFEINWRGDLLESKYSPRWALINGHARMHPGVGKSALLGTRLYVL